MKEWTKPLELNYRNLKAVVELPEHRKGFTAVVKHRNNKLYIEPYKRSDFNSNTLYVVAFTHYYLQDYKNKKTKWYLDKYADFLANQTGTTINSIYAITVGGWWNTQEQRYNVDLGVITVSKDVALDIKKRYKQLSGWDLIKEEEIK